MKSCDQPKRFPKSYVDKDEGDGKETERGQEI